MVTRPIAAAPEQMWEAPSGSGWHGGVEVDAAQRVKDVGVEAGLVLGGDG
ncbi:hypothetical protein OG345_41050 (plasmid) [Streptomyces sp. NBC_01220]|nr:hypothetical protein OG345_41050 [Streptomyces sp. NBC_01220]